MSYRELRKKNPRLPLIDVSSAEFSDYGRLLSLDCTEILAAAREIPMPKSGSVYLPGVEAFERLPVAKTVRDTVFGTLDTQLGYCYGFNDRLNATEWHASSEVNIAVTDLVLILGRRQEIDARGMLHSARMKAFFLPAGSAVEIYATTLHFCPCQAQAGGFGCVVGLPKGTNLPLDEKPDDPLLFRRNKWLLAHETNTDLIARGAVAGITGENLCVIH